MLTIAHPDGITLHVEAPLPADFAGAVASARERYAGTAYQPPPSKER